MLQFIGSDIKFPCTTTIQRRIFSEKEDKEIAIKNVIRHIPGSVDLTSDAWSSRVYRKYMSVTMHYIDSNWQMKSIVLDFLRFHTPHTGEAFETVMMAFIDKWEISSKVRAVRTDNDSDVARGMYLLHARLPNPSHIRLGAFNVRCHAHVIDLGVKDRLHFILKDVDSIRSLVTSIRCSVKRRDTFEQVKAELEESNVALPGLDVYTRWSSTYAMIKRDYEGIKVLTVVLHRIPELLDQDIDEADW